MVKYGITAVTFFLAILILIATTLVQAEAPPKESQYYRDLTKQHFDLAVYSLNKRIYLVLAVICVSARAMLDTSMIRSSTNTSLYYLIRCVAETAKWVIKTIKYG
jgi:hypothetical protein